MAINAFFFLFWAPSDVMVSFFLPLPVICGSELRVVIYYHKCLVAVLTSQWCVSPVVGQCVLAALMSRLPEPCDWLVHGTFSASVIGFGSIFTSLVGGVSFSASQSLNTVLWYFFSPLFFRVLHRSDTNYMFIYNSLSSCK